MFPDPHVLAPRRGRCHGGMTLSGRYVLGRWLGSGGMGDVYEATEIRFGRSFAVKMLRAELVIYPELRARFQLEAELAAGLRHPNIVQVTDFHHEPGEPAYLVMELLEGQSLRELIAVNGRVTPERTVSIAAQILAALAATHSAGIVHRDVKPGNVFVTQTVGEPSFVKLLDFGVAKVDPARVTEESGPLSVEGQVLGTSAYMAPEQAIGTVVDARADLFGVGALMFHAISGCKPRQPGPEGPARSPSRKLREVSPWAPAPLAAIVDKALSCHPEERFGSAEEMEAALRGLLPIYHDVGSTPSRPREDEHGQEGPQLTTRRGPSDTRIVLRSGDTSMEWTP